MGYMEILPALPDKFKNGSIKGIKAKGNITVDITWENNKATEVVLLSPIAQELKIKVDNTVKTVNLKPDKTLKLL